jgi:TonB family protein
MRFLKSRMVFGLIIVFAVAQTVFAAEPPVVISSPRPAYPAEAAAGKVSGAVLVDVRISADGKVIEANPITGHQILRDSSKKAALLWRFKALEGSSVIRSVRLTFIYHETSYVEPKEKPEFTSPYQAEMQWLPVIDCFNKC